MTKVVPLLKQEVNDVNKDVGNRLGYRAYDDQEAPPKRFDEVNAHNKGVNNGLDYRHDDIPNSNKDVKGYRCQSIQGGADNAKY